MPLHDLEFVIDASHKAIHLCYVTVSASPQECCPFSQKNGVKNIS